MIEVHIIPVRGAKIRNFPELPFAPLNPVKIISIYFASQIRVRIPHKGDPSQIKNSKPSRTWGLFDCCCSVAQLCLTLWDPMGCRTPGSPVLLYLPEFAQTHVLTISSSVTSSSAFNGIPGEFHGQRRLVGYSPWHPNDSDTTRHAQALSIKSTAQKLPTR